MKPYSFNEITFLAKKIGETEGVIAVILFGSYARGDYDEGSDIDLLVLFKNKKKLLSNWRKLMKITSKFNLFVQMIPLTVKELVKSSLFSLVLREGKILYRKNNFNLMKYAKFEPYVLIAYDLSKLDAKRKVKFLQKFYGRKCGKYLYKGIVESAGGFKVGRGSVIIPLKGLKNITNFLENEKIPYNIRYLWMLEAS